MIPGGFAPIHPLPVEVPPCHRQAATHGGRHDAAHALLPDRQGTSAAQSRKDRPSARNLRRQGAA
ncbi:MAG: hypothetical protein B7X55_13650, partial [Rhodobacterales bacterium 34-62-10]